MTPVFERAKTIHALDCAATVIGDHTVLLPIKPNKETVYFKTSCLAYFNLLDVLIPSSHHLTQVICYSCTEESIYYI
jgi:hypothetical protein